MRSDRSFNVKMVLSGFLCTSGGVLAVISIGWNIVTVPYLFMGIIFLIVPFVSFFASGWINRSFSHLPEDWHTLSSEEQHEYVIQRGIERSNEGNVVAKVLLWIVRLMR